MVSSFFRKKIKFLCDAYFSNNNMKNPLRQKIITRLEAGERRCDVAKAMNVHIQTVYKAWKDYKARGTTDYVRKRVREKSVRTPKLVDAVKRSLDQDNNVSIRKLAREHNVPVRTMGRLVKVDLGMRSLALTPCQALTPTQKEKRVAMGTIMLNKLKGDAAGKTLIFSDEKDFHMDKHANRRNTRVIAKSNKDLTPDQKYLGHSKFPRKAMLFGFVGSDGKIFPPVWVRTPMDSVQYKAILVRKVFPILDATYGKGNYIWTQDGASCHTSNLILNYLRNRLGSSGYWSKGIWPPNSCNLNPLDFSIWNQVEMEACKVSHNSKESLKAAVEEAWNSMDGAYIRKVCSRFRTRVEKMLAAKGGIFEKEKK